MRKFSMKSNNIVRAKSTLRSYSGSTLSLSNVSRTSLKNLSIKAAIFDFDELLFDNTRAWDKAYHKFLEVKGLKDQDFGDWGGGGLRDFIEVLKNHGLRGSKDELIRQYRRY